MTESIVQRQSNLISPLTDGKTYRLWVARVKARLQELQQWNEKTESPKETQEASNFLLGVLSDSILEHFLDSNFSAPLMWQQLAKKFLVHSLSAQSTAFTSLINFNYSHPTMATNKTALLSLARDLRTSFKNQESIDVDDIVMLFALINVPPEYHHLRSTLEETNKNGLKLDSLFESLEREESLSVSSARRAALSAKTNGQSVSPKCIHRRPAATCWTCHPNLRPTCATCHTKGYPKFHHVTDSKFCKQQNERAPSSQA